MTDISQGISSGARDRRVGVLERYLQAWNGLSNALIKPGQVLVVGEEAKTGGQYTVVQGDTLYSIARKFGLQPEDLARQNNISLTTTLLTGTTLNIPTAID